MVQNLIPKSQMLSIQAGTTVVLVFDTDVPQTSNLKKNLELLTRYCGKLKIIFLPQVLNLEDELVRCTDVRTAMELTKSGSVKNFKTDFCKMKTKDCRSMLERHKLDYARLWMTKTPEAFSFVENNSFPYNSKKGQHCVQCGYSLEAKAGKYGVYVQCCGAQRHEYKLDEI